MKLKDYSLYWGWLDPILRIGVGQILVKISGSNIEKKTQNNYCLSDI